MENIYLAKLDNGASLEAVSADGVIYKTGDIVLVKRDFCNDLVEIRRQISAPSHPDKTGELPKIQRLAADDEIAAANKNAQQAKEMMPVVEELIAKQKLGMDTVNARYSLDKKMFTVQFCAEGRVDFRELVKEMSRAIGARIELRQIGVRDGTGFFGGIGVCGRPLCCSSFLKEFYSINVKMAKEQDLSLTPVNISGVCGRLKCCLKYEHEGYLALEKTMPRKGETCETPKGRGKVIDRNLLTQTVTVGIGDNSFTFPVAEIKW